MEEERLATVQGVEALVSRAALEGLWQTDVAPQAIRRQGPMASHTVLPACANETEDLLEALLRELALLRALLTEAQALLHEAAAPSRRLGSRQAGNCPLLFRLALLALGALPLGGEGLVRACHRLQTRLRRELVRAIGRCQNDEVVALHSVEDLQTPIRGHAVLRREVSLLARGQAPRRLRQRLVFLRLPERRELCCHLTMASVLGAHKGNVCLAGHGIEALVVELEELQERCLRLLPRLLLLPLLGDVRPEGRSHLVQPDVVFGVGLRDLLELSRHLRRSVVLGGVLLRLRCGVLLPCDRLLPHRHHLRVVFRGADGRPTEAEATIAHVPGHLELVALRGLVGHGDVVRRQLLLLRRGIAERRGARDALLLAEAQQDLADLFGAFEVPLRNVAPHSAHEVGELLLPAELLLVNGALLPVLCARRSLGRRSRLRFRSGFLRRAPRIPLLGWPGLC
mmetsp:Transcript_47957/g.138059  ORF Transcript_47957/g.138059 Transcript_47957/m.138059 type:complete len:455 (-) Transcript_47957:905-2269(-)